jgi:hypothetical protein
MRQPSSMTAVTPAGHPASAAPGVAHFTRSLTSLLLGRVRHGWGRSRGAACDLESHELRKT